MKTKLYSKIRNAGEDFRSRGGVPTYVRMNANTAHILNREYGVFSDGQADRITVLTMPFGHLDVLIDGDVPNNQGVVGGEPVNPTHFHFNPYDEPGVEELQLRIKCLLRDKKELIAELDLANAKMTKIEEVLNDDSRG